MKKLLTTALLAIGLASSASAQQTKEYTFRPIKINPTDKGGLYTVPVTIEGKSTNFLFDTGSPTALIYDVSIPKALKREVTPLEQTLGGAGGKSRAWLTNIEKTTIGGMVGYGKQPKALVTQITNLDKYTIDGKPARISGIVGAPVLAKMRGIFDYRTARLLIPAGNPPRGLYKNSLVNKGGHAVPIAITKSGVPYITVKIQDQQYAFMIDTGAATNFILPSLVKQLSLEITDRNTTVSGLGSEKQKAKYTHIDKPLLANKLQIPKMEAVILDLSDKIKPPQDLKPGGILGNKTLKSIGAQLDYDSSSLIIPNQK